MSDSPWKIEMNAWGGDTCVKYKNKILDGVTSVEVSCHSGAEKVNAKIGIEFPLCNAIIDKNKIVIRRKESVLKQIKDFVRMGLLTEGEVKEQLK